MQGERSFKALEMKCIDLLEIRVTKTKIRNYLPWGSAAKTCCLKARPAPWLLMHLYLHYISCPCV